MPIDIRSSARYQTVIADYRAMLEPGLGMPSGIDAAELGPGGRVLAAVVRIVDVLEGEGRTELRILDVDTGTSTTVTGVDGSVSDPRWAPDGRLAFLADHGHPYRFTPWMATHHAGGWTVRELPSPPGVVEQVRWSPDCRRLALTVAGLGAEQADGLGSGTVGDKVEDEAPAWYPSVESTEGTDEWRTAWVLDLADGSMAQWSPDGRNIWEADWLGGTALVAVVSDGPAEDTWYRSRLVRIGADGAETVLYQPTWQLQFAEGSPDGLCAAVIEGVASDRYFTYGDIVVVPMEGDVRPLGRQRADLGAVRWDGPSSLIALGVDGMETVAVRVDPGGADATTELLRVRECAASRWMQVSSAGGRIALVLSGPAEPDRLVIAQGGSARTLLATKHVGHQRIRDPFASIDVIDWRAPDGTHIEGVLALPHGTPPFPLVLWVHGGPVGAVGLNHRSPTGAAMVKAGYAVVYPNPRGSVGRGRAFAAAVVGAMGGPIDAGDLLAVTDHLVAAGIADPARLVVAGISYGGYMAARLPAMDDRFAASVAVSPVTDLVSAYYSSSLTAFFHDYIGGRPEEHLERYVERSSVFAGSRLRTPTLLGVGLRDRATPPGQAYEHFRALREQGTPAELAVYPAEGHGLAGFEAWMDFLGRMILWLERFAPPNA